MPSPSRTNPVLSESSLNIMSVVQPALPTYLRAPDAAALLGISKGTAANWRSQGKGPAYSKVGSSLVVYELADLTDFITSGRVSA